MNSNRLDFNGSLAISKFLPDPETLGRIALLFSAVVLLLAGFAVGAMA